MKKFVRVLLFVVFGVLGVSSGFGQSQNGSISGVVTDTSGAAIAGANVTVTNVATGGIRTTVTTGAGDYTVQQLPPQDYKVSVTAATFGTTTAQLNVSVGSTNTVNLKMSAQGAAVSVDVAANSMAGINLETSENSQVISTQQILELPTETRNPYDLAALSGSVSSDPSITADRGVKFNVSGARSASTEILLNGAENTVLFSVNVATPIPLDATQEFRIITSNFSPEYGRASGGVVNVITKSGTNRIHGTAYEFFRPSTFASNSYLNNANGIPAHRFTRNNFGYSVGGPILKDKLFGYSSTEWVRVRSSNVVQYYIPTSQFIAASNANTQAFFNAFGKVSAAPTGKLLTLGQLGTSAANGGVTTAFQKDRIALEALPGGVFTDAFPILQQVNVTVPIDAGGGAPQNTYNTIGRVDFNPSTKTQYYGQYVRYNYATPLGGGNNSPYAGYSTAQTTLTQNVQFAVTHTFSPQLTSVVQLSGLRVNVNQPLGANPAGPTMFINSGAAPLVANNPLVFPGYSENNAGNGLPSGGPQNNIQVSPVATYTKGRHTFTLGGQYTYIRDNHTFAIYENAQESLVVSGTAGALTNFQAGNSNFFQANIDPQGKYPCMKDLVTGVLAVNSSCQVTTPVSQPNFSRSNRYQEFAGFFNDSWKTSPRLTLTAGLRYDWFGTQHNKNPALDSNFYFGTTGSLQDRVRAGKILRVNDAAPAGVQNPGGKLWNVNAKQFAPRVGFAYDLTGDGKTSLRGGYGISYERNFGNVTYNVALNPPSQLATSFSNVDTGGPIPISTGALGQFSGVAGITKTIPQGSVRAVDPKIKPAYNQFYTLALEHQVTSTVAAGAAYTGERGIHNYSIANYNRSYYGQVYEGDAAKYAPSGAKNTNRLNPQYTAINVRGADGDSYYNGVNAFVRGSNIYRQGLTATLNYTYSHSTDNTSSTFTDGQSNGDVGGVAYFDPYNHAIDHGNSDFDVRHRLSVSTIWAIPYADKMNGLARSALGGWEIGAIFSASTGTPFTMYDCGLPNITACPRARFTQTPSYKRTGDSAPVPNSPDEFAYINFPTYYDAAGNRNNAAYGTYVDPKTNYTSGLSPVDASGNPIPGSADLPTIVGGQDTFPGGMSARNAFRGPGAFQFDMDVNKNIRLTERYSIQLRAEAYNVLNHANSYLNLGGANDVSNTSFAQTYKNGPGQGNNRQLQLAGKFIF